MCCVGQVRPMQPVPKLTGAETGGTQLAQPLVQQIAHLLCEFDRPHLFQ
jgi:hypothetical protein